MFELIVHTQALYGTNEIHFGATSFGNHADASGNGGDAWNYG